MRFMATVEGERNDNERYDRREENEAKGKKPTEMEYAQMEYAT